jgi:lysophospholipase L1-like esterase
MKMSPILLIALLLSASCEEASKIEEVDVPQETSTGDDLRYLALGDSYTIGQSVTEAERWPVILAKDLSSENIKVKPPEIIATTGWTTTNLLDALVSAKPANNYDMVSLLIGVNNQYQGRSIEVFRTEFNQLLHKSIEYAAGNKDHVFVLSIPDWGVSTFASPYQRDDIALEIDRFNAVAKAECDKEKILFIDITQESRKALNDPTMLARDGLHFSGLMHQKWVNVVINNIKGRVIRK